jgi:hypothetical protein
LRAVEHLPKLVDHYIAVDANTERGELERAGKQGLVSQMNLLVTNYQASVLAQ